MMLATDYTVILSAAAFLFVAHALRSFRTLMILGSHHSKCFRFVFLSIILGSLCNLFLPFRLGELIRLLVLSRSKNISLRKAFSVTALDRIFDILLFAILFVFIFLFTGKNLTVGIYLVSLCLFVIFCLMAVFLKFPSVRQKLTYRLHDESKPIYQLVLFGIYWFFSRLVHCTCSLRFLIITLLMWSCYFGALLPIIGWERMLNAVISMTNISNLLVADFERIPIDIAIWPLIHMLVVIAGVLLIFLVSCSKNTTVRLDKSFLKLLSGTHQAIFELENLFANKKSFLNNILMRQVDLINLGKRLVRPKERLIHAFRGGSGAVIVGVESQDSVEVIRKYAENQDLQKRLASQYTLVGKLADNGLPIANGKNLVTTSKHTMYEMTWKRGYLPVPDIALELKNENLDKVTEIVMSAIADLCSLSERTEKKYTYVNEIKYVENKLQANLVVALNASEKFLPTKKTIDGDLVFSKLMDADWSAKQLSSRRYSLAHGDATLENLIVNLENVDYYWIDPNSTAHYSNLMLDFGKILQSLNYAYDFHEIISHTSDIEITSITNFKPLLYHHVEEKFLKFVERNYGSEALREAYFHEIIHYSRLLNYKMAISRTLGEKYLKLMETLASRYINRFER